MKPKPPNSKRASDPLKHTPVEEERLRRENAELRAEGFADSLGDKLGKSGIDEAKKFYTKLAMRTATVADLEAFAAAIPRDPILRAAREAAETARWSTSEHFAALDDLKARGVRPNSPNFGQEYDAALARVKQVRR